MWNTSRTMWAVCVFITALALPASNIQGASSGELEVVVALVDSDLQVKPVPKMSLEVVSSDTGQVFRGSTGFDGVLKLQLPPGVYSVQSVEPITFEGRKYSWKLEATVSSEQTRRLELSNDNAAASPGRSTPGPDRIRVGLGIGLVGNVVTLDDGGDIGGNGVYGVVNASFPTGLFLQFALSGSRDTESTPVDDEIGRAAITAGYLFRRGSTVKPFVYGGIASIGVEETVFDTTVVSDGSLGFTLGGGLIAGINHHNFQLDVVHDTGYEVQVLGGFESQFDLTEVRVGYLYRF